MKHQTAGAVQYQKLFANNIFDRIVFVLISDLLKYAHAFCFLSEEDGLKKYIEDFFQKVGKVTCEADVAFH